MYSKTELTTLLKLKSDEREPTPSTKEPTTDEANQHVNPRIEDLTSQYKHKGVIILIL